MLAITLAVRTLASDGLRSFTSTLPWVFNKETVAAITSIGTLAYAVGKFYAGSLADALGGKLAF